MDSLNLGETWLLDKTSRNLVEWDTFRLWLVIACNGQNRCDKSTAQRFWTAIVIAMGQQKRSKRTTSKKKMIGFKPNLSHFSFLKSLHKKHVFRTFWGLSGGRRSRFYKKLCTRVSLQNAAHDKSHPETRSLCAFCRVVVPTHPSTNTALDYKMLLESEATPPATKCNWGFWWWIKS